MNQSPLTFNDLLLIGNKKTTLFIIDIISGRIIEKSDNQEIINFSKKKSLNIPNILIPEFNEDTILQTIIVNDENQNPNDEQKVETSIVFKTLGKHKLLNEETTNKNILEGY